MKQVGLLLLFLLAGCAPWTPPAGLDVSGITPDAIDDDYTNVLRISGSGFSLVEGLHFQLGGIAGPRIEPLFPPQILSDTEMEVSIALADASNTRWSLVLYTNGSNLCEPFQEVLRIKSMYAKTTSQDTSGSGSWWVRFVFEDSSSLVMRHYLYTNDTVYELFRGDVVRIISLSNTLSGSPDTLHTYGIDIRDFSAKLNILVSVTLSSWPSNGQVIWEL